MMFEKIRTAFGRQGRGDGSAAPPKRVWTIGREPEKEHARIYVKAPSQQALLFPVIDAVHDLNEGTATVEDFMHVASGALRDGGKTVWNSVDKWVLNVAKIYPQAKQIWDDLARNEKWSVRRQIAGRLYWYMPDEQSDRLFASLRHDISSAVRELAIERYEYRPGPDRDIVKLFDAEDPTSPGFNGS